MSSDPGQPTLDQLRVFLAVAKSGSFAAAARVTGRATSVVSYTIANLEAQLGVSLFDRRTTRKPQLTKAGRSVLEAARGVADSVDVLRARVKSLTQGLEAEVHIALDVMLPAWRVVDGLKAFLTEFPSVTLFMNIEALGAVTRMVLARSAVIGVSGPLGAGVDGIEHISIGDTRIVPVAAPNHPLAVNPDNPPGAGRGHVQLVLTDRSELTKGREFGVVASHTWRLADLGAKYRLLKEGIGWGGMPLSLVRDDIAAGRLVRLNMPDYPDVHYALDAIYRRDTPPGPAAAWLIERFKNQVEQEK